MSHSRQRALVASSVTGAMLLLAFVGARAQWMETEGPSGADVTCFARSGSLLLAGTSGKGVYASSDEGANWWSLKDKATNDRDNITALAGTGTSIIAGSDKGITRSTDAGATWAETSVTADVRAVIVTDAGLLSATSEGLQRSTDDGATWSAAPGELPTADATAVFASGNTRLVAFPGDGLYRSVDGGASWSQVPTTVPPIGVLAASGSRILAGTVSGVYQSTDVGLTWSVTSEGLGDTTKVVGFATLPSGIFAATDGNGVVHSTNDGVTWTRVNVGLSADHVLAIIPSGNGILVGATGMGNGVHRSVDGGATWRPSSTGMRAIYTYALAVDGTTLYAGGSGGLRSSTDNGASWNDLSAGLPQEGIGAILKSGSDLFVGTATYAADGVSGGVYHSTDDGASWARTTLRGVDVLTIVKKGASIFAATDGQGVARSTDNGSTWEFVNAGLPILNVHYLMVSGSDLFAATKRGVHVSTDDGATWTPRGLTSSSISCFGAQGSDIYAGSYGLGMARSTNNGASWGAINTGIVSRGSKFVYAIVSTGSALLAATGDGVYLSVDNGALWTPVSTGITSAVEAGVASLAVLESTVFASAGLFAGDVGIWKRPLSEFTVASATVDGTSSLMPVAAPNPTQGLLTLRGIPVGASVEVVTLLGERLVYVARINRSEQTVDLAGLAAGPYFLRITGAGASWTSVIVKE